MHTVDLKRTQDAEHRRQTEWTKAKPLYLSWCINPQKASKQKSKAVTCVHRGKQTRRLNRCCDKGEDGAIYTQRIIREVETAEGTKHGCRQWRQSQEEVKVKAKHQRQKNYQSKAGTKLKTQHSNIQHWTKSIMGTLNPDILKRQHDIEWHRGGWRNADKSFHSNMGF